VTSLIDILRVIQRVHDMQLYSDNRIKRSLSFNESDLLLLLDDNCLSLISLARLCGVFGIDPLNGECVDQLALSMYLIVLSKLRHSVTSQIDMTDLVNVWFVIRKLQ